MSNDTLRPRTPVDTANDFRVEDLRLKFFLPPPENLSATNPVKAQARYNLRMPGGQALSDVELDIGHPDHQQISALRLDGRLLVEGVDYTVHTDGKKRYAVLKGPVRDGAEIASELTLRPDQNPTAQGLFLSKNPITGVLSYVTHNEEEGFRDIIAPFPDRPSVPIASSKEGVPNIQTEITGPAGRLPQLLSNGNIVSSRPAEGGLHTVVWEITKAIPSYLFALVAGEFEVVTREYVNGNGKKITLETYTNPGDKDRAPISLAALEEAMRFDEEVYKFFYPYDTAKMVSVRAFNSRAMENPTLVIFRDVALLADPKYSSDAKIVRMINTVGHEQFHMLTGNDVTVRSFAQTALKEGLTTYRESQFMVRLFGTGERVRRIQRLRQNQFMEDQGPLAHAIFPDAAPEGRVLYDDTTYRKGAFLYGVLHTLIGDKFYDGMKLYQERFSGKAASFDDFLKAMSDASGMDLSGFRRWWTQPGTPEVSASWRYNNINNTWTLTIEQKTTGGPVTLPLPVRFVGANGEELAAQMIGPDGLAGEAKTDHMVTVSESKQTFLFKGFNNGGQPPVAAFGSHLLPINFKTDHAAGDFAALMAARGLDPMMRYEAAQSLMRQIMRAAYQNRGTLPPGDMQKLIGAYRSILAEQGTQLNPEMKSYMLQPPSVEEMSMLVGRDVDFTRLEQVRRSLQKEIGLSLHSELRQAFDDHESTPMNPADDLRAWGKETHKRSLRITVLGLLDAAGTSLGRSLVHRLAGDGNANISERQAAVALAASWGTRAGDNLVEKAGDDWRKANFPVLMDEWRLIKMTARHPKAFERARIETDKVLSNPSFTISDIESTALAYISGDIDTFTGGNIAAFHKNAGVTYPWIAGVIRRVARADKDRIALKLVRTWTRDIARLPLAQRTVMAEQLKGLARDLPQSTATSYAVRMALEFLDAQGRPGGPKPATLPTYHS